MSPWRKYITSYKKKHVCTFLPLLAVSSGEAVSGTGQGCMFLLGDSLLPSPLYACIGVSPALTQDFQAPGFLKTGIQPLLHPSPPCPSPGKGAPAWPDSPQPPPVVSLGCTWACSAPWRCRLAVAELSGRDLACWGPPVAPHLWASCHSGATFSFCPHWPFCILLSGPGDSALQPHRDPPFFFPSPGPSALALLPFPRPSALALLPLRSWEAPRSGFCPLPKPGCRVQSYVHSEGCPSAPAHWPLCLTLEPRERSLLL